MFKEISLVIKLIVSQVKSLGEIPGVVWSGVGILVSVVSLITILRKGTNKYFFSLMLAVGVGMIIFGIIKVRQMRKKTDEELAEKIKNRRGNQDGLDDEMIPAQQLPGQMQPANRSDQPISNGPMGRSLSDTHAPMHSGTHQPGQQHQQRPVQTQPQLRAAHPQMQHRQAPAHQPQQHALHQQQVKRFCPGCGAKIGPGHRFCSVCGSQI
ncbi:MAG: hypothetical protein KKF44_11000 [Nanoarchaeota archaeon]|nr:hypothetical protein [Nanoarchaeota archaeon]